MRQWPPLRSGGHKKFLASAGLAVRVAAFLAGDMANAAIRNNGAGYDNGMDAGETKETGVSDEPQ